MSATEFLKGQCQHCGNSIEFPAEGLGQTTPCPHCGQSTVLQAAHRSSNAATPSAKKSPTIFVSIGIVALLAIAGLVVILSMRKHEDAGTGTQSAPPPEPTATRTTNQPTDPAPAATAAAPKSLADLKSSPVTFEKTKGSSLVYAVGVLRNDSDHQRFGVHIELELSDARGNKVGIAKDYRAVIEPRQEWRFRALVLDSKATTATVSAIREE